MPTLNIGKATVDSLAATLAEATSLTTTMAGDLVAMLGDRESALGRRNYVRSAFALVEGVLSGLKGVLIEALPVFGVNLEPGELAMLEERSYALNDDGSVRGTRMFVKLPDNVRFTFRLGPRIFGEPVEIVYSDAGWAAFQASIRVRNRITHPKRPGDLNVSDDELRSLDKAVSWFRDAAVRMMLASKATLEKRIAR